MSTKFKISPKLQQFYNEMYDAVITENKIPAWFNRRCGLCANFGSYRVYIELNMTDELLDHFKSEGLDPAYPFNSYKETYITERRTGTIYQNHVRKAWIIKHSNNHW